ncbi:MAG: OmpA family protein [Geobacter sp.]|nr:OmpA family protein [Geobacter sp.]
MKAKLISLLVLVLSAIPVSGMAQNREGTFNLTPYVGGYTFDGGQELETGLTSGIRAGYNFTRHVGGELSFGGTDTKYDLTGQDADAYRYGGELLYHFVPEQRLVPFLAAGVGGLTRDYPPGIQDETYLYADYGAGLKYFITDWLALRGDVRHLIVMDGGRSNLEYTMGVTFQMGGAQPPPEPVPAPEPPPVVKEPPVEPIPVPEPTRETMKYCVTLDIEFDIDKAIVRKEYHNEVAKVGDFMKKYPTTTAVIEGHTDEVGTAEHNMELSHRRAEGVVDYLVANFGIDRSRLSAKGYGKSRPKVPNGTDEQRQANRRIEAIIDCAIDLKDIEQPPERLCLTLKIEFDTDSAEIKSDYHEELARVASYMQKYPTVTGVVEGHTDDVGGMDYNMKLSRKRAESVVNYLVETFGIDRSRLSAKGYGPTRRIAYNTTPEGRQKNRRINMILDCVVPK